MDRHSVESLVETLVKDEGFIPHVYKCPKGYWTIGHGILVDKRRGGGITEEESKYLMTNRLLTAIDKLVTFHWFVRLSDARRSAIMQMTYNLGLAGLYEFKKMIAALREENYSLAADEALDSKWAKQVGSRADRIANLIRQG